MALLDKAKAAGLFLWDFLIPRFITEDVALRYVGDGDERRVGVRRNGAAMHLADAACAQQAKSHAHASLPGRAVLWAAP